MKRFGRYQESMIDLGAECSLNALKDAGVQWKEINAAYCSHVLMGVTVGQFILMPLGPTGIPIFNVDNGCAGGTTAMILARQAIGAGIYDVVLIIGIQKMGKGVLGPEILDLPETDRIHRNMGLLSLPSKYAMIARRHMEEYGTTVEQLAQVSVKNHKHGALNPYSQHQREFTLEEVLGSRMISDPLTLYQCAPTGDGVAALVLCAEDIAHKYPNKPRVKMAGAALCSQVYVPDDPTSIHAFTIKASREAYEMAGCGPEDLDVIELHDCFSIAEICHYENLGLCLKGEGGRLIDEGATEIGGRLPVNTSGGLLSRGDPTGATGVGQVVEIVWQLRGEAGKRQVPDAKVGLTHNLTGLVCSVQVLTR
jgi:benzoylsuccinyl-CoA thiolase BbsB subunit